MRHRRHPGPAAGRLASLLMLIAGVSTAAARPTSAERPRSACELRCRHTARTWLAGAVYRKASGQPVDNAHMEEDDGKVEVSKHVNFNGRHKLQRVYNESAPRAAHSLHAACCMLGCRKLKAASPDASAKYRTAPPRPTPCTHAQQQQQRPGWQDCSSQPEYRARGPLPACLPAAALERCP